MSQHFGAGRIIDRSRSHPRVSIVIPALNEARNLSTLLPQLPPAHEVILVDGGSVDGTMAAARAALPGVITVLQGRRGKGNALAAGFARVTGDVVVVFEADGTADPAEIPRFVRALTDGADFAKGSRFVAGGGAADHRRLRTWGNRLLNRVSNLVFGSRHTDLCYGFNAFWADLLPLLDLPDPRTPPRESASMYWGDGSEVETIIACRFSTRAGLVVAEVPSVERLRLAGRSHLVAVRDGVRALRTILAEWRRARVIRRTDEQVARLGPATSTPVRDRVAA